MLHEQVQEELFHSECIRYVSRHLSLDGTKGGSGNVGGLPKPPIGSGSKDTMLVLKQPSVDTKLVEISLTSWLVLNSFNPKSLTHSYKNTHTHSYKNTHTGWIQLILIKLLMRVNPKVDSLYISKMQVVLMIMF